MPIQDYLLCAFLVVMMMPVGGAAYAQNYPSKTIRIVTSPPAGAQDLTTRTIAQEITPALGQPVIVDNRGGGFVPITIVANAPADGYTLLAYGFSLWIKPFLQDAVPYDPVKDFSPITLTVSSPVILAAHPSVAVSSARELIALAKAKPGTINYGSANAGTAPHIGMELFKAMAGVDMVRVPYKGAATAINGLIGGEVQVIVATAGSLAPHIKTGKLKALGVGSVNPSELTPGLPTIAATGLPGYEFSSTWGILAPAKTPGAIINRISQTIVQVLKQADVKEQLKGSGVEVVASSPAQFAATIRSDMVRLGKVIKEAGIHD